MAELCSTQVTLYQSSLSLNDFAVLIVNDLSTLSAHHQAQLTKMPVGWYWNNKAYASCSFNWFTRLWRTITHAH